MAQGPPEQCLPQRRQAQDIAASYASTSPDENATLTIPCGSAMAITTRLRSVWPASATITVAGPAWSVEARMVRGVFTRPRFCGEPPAYPAFAGAVDNEAPTRGCMKARGWAWVRSLPSRCLLQVQRSIFVDNNVIDNEMQAGGEGSATVVRLRSPWRRAQPSPAKTSTWSHVRSRLDAVRPRSRSNRVGTNNASNAVAQCCAPRSLRNLALSGWTEPSAASRSSPNSGCCSPRANDRADARVARARQGPCSLEGKAKAAADLVNSPSH